jgi:hypothetical protein
MTIPASLSMIRRWPEGMLIRSLPKSWDVSVTEATTAQRRWSLIGVGTTFTYGSRSGRTLPRHRLWSWWLPMRNDDQFEFCRSRQSPLSGP